MKDQITSFETAKLAEKKGFDVISRFGHEASLYNKEGKHVYYSNYGFQYSGLSEGYIYAPTQSLLQKWLREIHNIQMFLHPYVTYPNDERKKANSFACDVVNNTTHKAIKSKRFNTYEEALEFGLFNALNHIIK